MFQTDASWKSGWLRKLLLAKVVVTYLIWALPALAAPPALLRWLRLPVPADPIYLRLFGAAVAAMGVAYWYAYLDPLGNIAILRVGVIDNGLITLTVIILGLSVGVSSWFVWASGVVTALFCAGFVLLMPRGGEG